MHDHCHVEIYNQLIKELVGVERKLHCDLRIHDPRRIANLTKILE
jgi:hypothetical protein